MIRNRIERFIEAVILERAACAIERIPNTESPSMPSGPGSSPYFYRAMALKEAAAAVRALKPKEDHEPEARTQER